MGEHFPPKPPRSENKCGKMQAPRSKEGIRAEVEVMQRLQRGEFGWWEGEPVSGGRDER